mmetsp:Transcript_39069/g.93554  ORF Transcript_39069/g.93554 Transcript_39069/m.93554 type:complete len:221 (+) Transcript_39069:509-1171(+)
MPPHRLLEALHLGSVLFRHTLQFLVVLHLHIRSDAHGGLFPHRCVLPRRSLGCATLRNESTRYAAVGVGQWGERISMLVGYRPEALDLVVGIRKLLLELGELLRVLLLEGFDVVAVLPVQLLGEEGHILAVRCRRRLGHGSRESHVFDGRHRTPNTRTPTLQFLDEERHVLGVRCHGRLGHGCRASHVVDDRHRNFNSSGAEVVGVGERVATAGSGQGFR